MTTNPMKQLSLLLHLFLLIIIVSACSSIDPARQLEKGTPLAISVTTDDVLVTGDISQQTARNFGRNVLKQLMRGLEDRGITYITYESAETLKERNATLKIDLTSVQAESKFDSGPFGTSTKNIFRVSYTATLTSVDGTRLFRFDGREKGKVLDELPLVVGRYVAKRVANYYRAEK